MTREEAIQVLQTALTSPFIYGEYADAINMAIEALQTGTIEFDFNKYHPSVRNKVHDKHDLANSHGKWQYTEHLMRCSECGTIFNKQTEMFDFESFAKYCPYCGSEMRGDG